MVRRHYPEVFASRAKLSRELKAKLVRVNGDRIFLDELPEDLSQGDTPAEDFECGIFCGTDDIENDRVVNGQLSLFDLSSYTTPIKKRR
jgi:hypothetical protein